MAFLRLAILLAMLVVAGVSMAQTSAGTNLVVLNGESGHPLACMPVEAGMPFYFDFINSIYLAPVRETLVYTEGEGVSVIRVESPSAGVFEYYGLEPDRTGIALMHRLVGKIRVRSFSYENHRLTVGGKILRIKEIAEGGQPLLIEVRDRGEGCGP